MKLLYFILAMITLSVSAQTESIPQGGEYRFNSDIIPCITTEQRFEIKNKLKMARKALIDKGILPLQYKSASAPPKFIIPVKKAANTAMNEVWAISYFVDHNLEYPNKLQDYNCGTRTYDDGNKGYNHQGTDFYTWPFSWYQFQNNMAEVVAAAPGKIIYKHDGEFDMSCDFNNNQWNAIYIEHNDGSIAWYGHLKKNTLSTKAVGATVAAGEYLGVVGSSGNSSGPHLHFEVYDRNDNLIDPFTGNCNSGSSWWQNQVPYRNPTINALLLHTAEIAFNTCPETETTNISFQFLPNTSVYTASYFKDQLAGTSAFYKLYKPDGEVFAEWTYLFNENYDSSYWYWHFNNLSDLGEWTFECTYQGKTVQQKFKVVNLISVAEENLEKLSLAPNPVSDKVKFIGNLPDAENYQMKLYNTIGQEVFKTPTFLSQFDLGNLEKGVYYLKIYNNLSGASKTYSIIKR